jgi:hypothetical protein
MNDNTDYKENKYVNKTVVLNDDDLKIYKQLWEKGYRPTQIFRIGMEYILGGKHNGHEQAKSEGS